MSYRPVFAIVLLSLAVCSSAAHAQRSAADRSSDMDELRDLGMMAARDRTMLHHTRFILDLAEAETARRLVGDYEGLSTIAAAQVALAGTLSTYIEDACGQNRLPRDVRDTACALRSRANAVSKLPAALTLADLSYRADAIDDLIGSWWDKVCDFAPAAATPNEAVCVLE